MVFCLTQPLDSHNSDLTINYSLIPRVSILYEDYEIHK